MNGLEFRLANGYVSYQKNESNQVLLCSKKFLLGLQQPGFLTNLNHLIPWDINPHNNQTSTTNAAGGGAAQYHQQRTTATRSYKNNRR
ncbi:unnamed protein product, partial [Rotaria sordida]